MEHGLNHVEIYVSDLKASIEFWSWLFPEIGFEEYQSWGEGRSWRCGETYVVLVQAPESELDMGFHRKRPGLNHLAFFVPSGDRVEDLTRQLRDRGVTILYEDRGSDAIGAPTRWSVFFEDPDRIKVELQAASD